MLTEVVLSDCAQPRLDDGGSEQRLRICHSVTRPHRAPSPHAFNPTWYATAVLEPLLCPFTYHLVPFYMPPIPCPTT
jgi:hypothetical protein